MAGFLNKKDRLIDYKLTENGRKQLASGDIRFKYYTFSDRSIHYESSVQDNKIISDSEFYYLPFEVSTNPGLTNNPEYYLSNTLSFENTEDNIFRLKQTQKVLGNSLSSQNYISRKKITNNLVSGNGEIYFDNLDLKSEFDFANNSSIRRYPTIKFFEENISNIENVENDKRFSTHLKNLKLIPESSLGQKIINDNNVEIVESGLNFIYKTLDLKNNIELNSPRESSITKAINVLKKNKNRFFYLEYELNSSYLSNDDIFNFEIHSINEDQSLSKLPIVSLGKFFDKDNNKFINVYLIGKFIKKNEIEEFKNFENKTYYFEEISNYYFINLFTLVAE